LTNHHLKPKNELWQRLNQQHPMEFAVPMFFFQKDSLVESMVYQLKYNGQKEIGTFLGNWMGGYLKESNIFS
jgi:predicted amidophosphoribosyltransferase